jgi:hypothetical protein
MCRSIKILRFNDRVAEPQEIEAAALQFVRKVSNFRKPSKRNQEAFDLAVAEITESARRLLQSVAQPEAVA